MTDAFAGELFGPGQLLAVLATALVVLLIYRNTLEMHEDDQLFIGSAESHMAKEQEDLQAKMNRLEPMVNVMPEEVLARGQTLRSRGQAIGAPPAPPAQAAPAVPPPAPPQTAVVPPPAPAGTP